MLGVRQLGEDDAKGYCVQNHACHILYSKNNRRRGAHSNHARTKSDSRLHSLHVLSHSLSMQDLSFLRLVSVTGWAACSNTGIYAMTTSQLWHASIYVESCLCFKREHVSCKEAISLIFWEVHTAICGSVQDIPYDSEKQISQEVHAQHQQEEVDNPYLNDGCECICIPHSRLLKEYSSTSLPMYM